MISSKSTLDNSPECILCFYVNTTSRIQIIRITNIPNFYWERVVFPGQRLIYQALPSAKLEIHTTECVTAILADVIFCQTLPCH